MANKYYCIYINKGNFQYVDENILTFKHRYGDAMLKKDFAEDSLQHELDLQEPLDFTCPIRILHGLDDQV